MKPLHLQEWLSSGVDEALVRLNVTSLMGEAPLEYLLYALPHSDRRNDGRLRDKYLRQYNHVQDGGWWVSGLDPLNNWQPMEWGRLKPDNPRLNWDKKEQRQTDKPVKYESPPKTPNRVTYLRATLEVWQRVAIRHNLPMPEKIHIALNGEALGFWDWVQSHSQVPVILCEGEKKAGCLLSLGFAAVGLPGIWNGRTGEKEAESLHPDLVPMAVKGREFIILFDKAPSVRAGLFTKRHGHG